MAGALRLALDDAGLPPEAIGFVNGHGTATEWGDIAETVATAAMLGARVPIHSLKSYFGHTLGACGGHRGLARHRDDARGLVLADRQPRACGPALRLNWIM